MHSLYFSFECIIDITCIYVSSSCLNYLNSYANVGGYNFMLSGYPIISINEDGVFNCKLRWSEDL